MCRRGKVMMMKVVLGEAWRQNLLQQLTLNESRDLHLKVSHDCRWKLFSTNQGANLLRPVLGITLYFTDSIYTLS